MGMGGCERVAHEFLLGTVDPVVLRIYGRIGRIQAVDFHPHRWEHLV